MNYNNQEKTYKMISSPRGYLNNGNGSSQHRLTYTHRRRRKTRRIVIILLFIVTEATTFCLSNTNHHHPEKQNHHHSPIYDQQQSPIANSTGATNKSSSSSSSSSRSSNNDHRIAQNISDTQDSWDTSGSMLDGHTRGLIDHYISRNDFGKLFSLGFDQVMKILFDHNDQISSFKWPENLSAKSNGWSLNCNHFDKIGQSVVDFLHQHHQREISPSPKKRTKRNLADDDVELFSNSTMDRLSKLGSSVEDKLIGQGTQMIKSVNPRAGASMKIIADDNGRDQDYPYEDNHQQAHQQRHQKGNKNRNSLHGGAQSHPPVAAASRISNQSPHPNRALKSNNVHNSKLWKSPKPNGPSPAPMAPDQMVLVADSEPVLTHPAPTVAPTDQPYGQNSEGTIESPLNAVDASLAAAPAEPMRYHTERRNLATLYDDQVGNGTQSGDERTGSQPFDPIVDSPEAPMRPSSQKATRSSRRRSATTIELPVSQNLAADSANLSAQVPAPEQNPLRVKDQREDSATNGDANDDSPSYDKQVVDSQQDNFVPQVGDQLILDHSGKRYQQQQRPSDQMSELLKKQRQLRELKSLIENGFSPSSSSLANSKGNKRRQGHSSKQADGNDYSPPTPMFAKEYGSPSDGTQTSSPSPFPDPVGGADDLRSPLDKLVRTNAPYAAIDPNIMTTGSENHVQQQSAFSSPQTQQHDFNHHNNNEQLMQNSPLIELASENNNNGQQQFRGTQQANRFSVPLQFGGFNSGVQGGGGGKTVASHPNQQQWRRQPMMIRQPMMVPEQQTFNRQIQEFFNGGGGGGSGLSPKSTTKHNKRAINFVGGTGDSGGRSAIQFSNQIYPYYNSNTKDPGGGNGRFASPVSNRLLRESESKQSSMLNGQYVMNQQRQPMVNYQQQQQQQDVNTNSDNNFPLDLQSDQYGVAQVGPTQGQLFGLLRAAPPMINQQRRQTPPSTNTGNGNGNGNQHVRMPVVPAPSYILPSFSTSLQSSTAGSNPLRYSRALSNNSYGGYMPAMRNPTNAAAYQHRIGRIANSGASSNSGYGGGGDDNGGNAQASVPTTSTSDPMWSDTQNQEEDYQQSPQTIQITAVPNGGFGFGGVNRFNNLGFNGLAGLNGLGYPGYPGWGAGGLDGRQVLLVNRQPQVGAGGMGGEWRSWMLPVAIILSLPLILGALFVPVFLKSVMFLIQILQMLGLLMPPSQLAQHLTAGSHNQSIG